MTDEAERGRGFMLSGSFDENGEPVIVEPRHAVIDHGDGTWAVYPNPRNRAERRQLSRQIRRRRTRWTPRRPQTR